MSVRHMGEYYYAIHASFIFGADNRQMSNLARGLVFLAVALAGAAPLGAFQAPAKAPVAGPAAKPPKSIDLSKLPPAVRATIEAETRNATLKHVSKETE